MMAGVQGEDREPERANSARVREVAPCEGWSKGRRPKRAYRRQERGQGT